MTDRNEPPNTPHITEERARGGVTPHVTRYVLSISLILTIIVFAFLFLR